MPAETGFAIWLTGLPASGKSTLAAALSERLAASGGQVQILDSDALREVLTPQPSYSEPERDWFYGVMSYIGQLLTQNGTHVIFAATARRQLYRDRARRAIEKFMEVYVHCSLETCRARDQKGIYAKAEKGEAATVPGVQVPYEVPQAPELVVDTEQHSPAEGARRIMALVTDSLL